MSAVGDGHLSVSVVMPVLNEAEHLADAVRSVLDQTHLGRLEVILAVAPSVDHTARIARKLAASEPRVRVVANPTSGTAAGLNLAIAASSGDVVVRVDGHAELPDGYIERAVELLRETEAVNVGGVQRAVGTTPMQQAIAAAMTSCFGVGDARFHLGGDAGPVDTVYLGVFRRDALLRVGGFDEELVRNQDYELNWRLRQAGGTVWFDPSLEVRYRPRSSLRELGRQYLEYGRWKRRVVQRAPASLRWRQIVPPLTVVAEAAGLAMSLRGRRVGLLAPAGYLVSATLAAAAADGVPPRVRARMPAVFAVMHHAWGLGFLLGVRSSGPADRQALSAR